MSVLSEILADKRTEVDCAKRRVPLGELERRIAQMPRPRDFHGALEQHPRPALIAEIKRASPSKGIIREDYDPPAVAREYAANGARCLSVLTDELHFHGHLSHLKAVRDVVTLPLLRKDFIIDEYQVFEARAAGADAILLIVAAIDPVEMAGMLGTARRLGMAAIVEVHNEEELVEALRTPARMIGINNRDLHRFRTDIQTTIDLLPMIPSDRLVISESGINHRSDVTRLGSAGVGAVLVGEALMRCRDIGGKVRELMGT